MRRLTIRPLARAASATVRHGTSRDKVVTAEDAAYLVPDNAVITVGGFVSQGCPDYTLEALANRFKQTGSPKGLTLLFGGGPGDSDHLGLNHLAVPGLLRRAIGSHYGQAPMLGKLAESNAIEAYMVPLGCISRMIRCAAAGQPGHITTVGTGTLVDPRNGGGKMNDITKQDIVSVINIKGKEYLFYDAIPIDVSFIRGTLADTDGNITMHKESLLVDHLIQAMAARSRRGVVVAQVMDVVATGSLSPRDVRIPGTLVDCVVQAPRDRHTISFHKDYDPSWTGEIRTPPRKRGTMTMPLNERKIIARRACLEILPDQVLNLGIGMPEGVALVAEEENVLQYLELTTEPGVHGGVGVSGHNFGPAVNPESLIEMHSQFDFYNGGGLDACFLGNAETDARGNVNVTRAGTKITGPGGFIDISQSTKRVNLMGTFTTSGLKIDVANGKLIILQEGKIKKFVKRVIESTFSAEQAIRNGQVVQYITERCVFSLTKKGITLVEVAPGIDVQKHVLDQMDFQPLIAKSLRLMDERIFAHAPMNIRETNFALRMQERIAYDADTNTLFVNMQHLRVYSTQDVDKLIHEIVAQVKSAAPQNGKVHLVVTYRDFDCAPDVVDYYQNAVTVFDRDYTLSVRRYSTRAFTRHKLDAKLKLEAESGKGVSLEELMERCRQMGVMVSAPALAHLFHRAAEGSDTITASDAETVLAKLFPGNI